MLSETLINNKLLILEAKRWVGVQEHGGNNRGEIVKMFQRTIGKAVNEPWCMSYIQYCLENVDEWSEALGLKFGPHLLHLHEHCMTVWRETPKECRLEKPIPGCVAIWNYKGNDNGHGSIVESIDRKLLMFYEGNTSDNNKRIIREGDGVRKKRRPFVNSIGNMKLVGFLNPWPEELSLVS